MRKLLFLISTILFFSCPQIFGQINSIQLTPVSYNAIPFSSVVKARVNTTTGLNYQRKLFNRFHIIGGLFYLNRFLNDKSDYCIHCSVGVQDLRQFGISIGPKYYFLQPKKRIQPYFEIDAIYNSIQSEGVYSNYSHGAYHERYDLNGQGFGFAIRPGVDVNLTKNLFFSFNAFLGKLSIKGKNETLDYIHGTSNESKIRQSIWPEGIEFRLGYRF